MVTPFLEVLYPDRVNIQTSLQSAWGLPEANLIECFWLLMINIMVLHPK